MAFTDHAIGDAIASTEKEIAGDAWGDEEIVQDETGERTLEQMGEGLEGQHEPDDDDAEDDESEGEESDESGEETGEQSAKDKDAKGETETDAKDGDGKDKPVAAKPEAEPQGRVPAGRLREQTERANAAEAAREALKQQLETERTESKRQFDALNARVDQLLGALKPQAQPVGETKPASPDFFDDPNAFIAQQTKPLTDQIAELQNSIAAQRVETSMALAHGKHGDGFAQAYAAVSKLDPRNPDDQVTVRRIYASPNPGEALVSWHKRNETLRQVGDDPTAYAERIRKEERDRLANDPEFRKQLVEGLRAEASVGDDGKPRAQVRLPRNLNGAAGGNRRMADPHQFDDSDEAVANSAWAS